MLVWLLNHYMASHSWPMVPIDQLLNGTFKYNSNEYWGQRYFYLKTYVSADCKKTNSWKTMSNAMTWGWWTHIRPLSPFVVLSYGRLNYQIVYETQSSVYILTLYLLDYALSYPEACYCSLFPCLGMPSNYLNKCWNNAFFWRFYKSIDDVAFFFMSVSSNIWFLGCCCIWGAKTEMYFEQLYYLRSAVLTDMYRKKDLKWLHWIGLLFDTKVSIKLMMGICNIYFG